jgi:hypothetical protein
VGRRAEKKSGERRITGKEEKREKEGIRGKEDDGERERAEKGVEREGEETGDRGCRREEEGATIEITLQRTLYSETDMNYPLVLPYYMGRPLNSKNIKSSTDTSPPLKASWSVCCGDWEANQSTFPIISS